MEDIKNKILENEYKRTLLTAKEIKLNPKITRFYDDLLPDMYCANFFEVSKNIDESDYILMLDFKNSRNEKHFKIVCDERNEFLLNKKMEENVLISMLKTDLNYTSKINNDLVFKCIKKDDIQDDLTNIEIKHFGKIYGEDFTKRRCLRFYPLAKKQDNNLYYFAAYKDDKIVSCCSLYLNDQIGCLDDLVTDEDYRHQGIATSLISYVHEYFKCPIFLHADFDDTPKEMYKKMGFSIVNTKYEYFKLDE